MITPNRLLSTKEAAEYLGLKPVTLNKWRCYATKGKPPWISLGRTIRYSQEDLDEWIESNKTSSDQEL
jgi:excisionase family DNA binding protein